MTTAEAYEFESIRYFRYGYSPIGKPTLLTHIFYVDGLLIDTGQNRAEKEILDTVRQLSIDQLFITHHHEDHTGNIAPIVNQHKCPAYASSRCCELMKSPPPISLAQKLVWGDRPTFQRLLPINRQIETANHVFKLIEIPGHAEDMVALYEPERKWLFSADLYVNSYIGYFLKNESILQQIDSIKQILELDFNVLLCSHNPQLTDGRKKLQSKLRYLEKFYHDVILLYEKGYNIKDIYKQLNLKEHGYVYLLSHGQLSKKNMVRSAIRDFDNISS